MSANRGVFVDTNILVYAYDRSEPEKQHRAVQVLDDLALRGAGWISAQVLAEFYVTLTRKLTAPFSPQEAGERVKNYLYSWRVADLSGLVVLEATRGVREHRLNFWDALIWATARLNQCPLVLSEDFAGGVVLEGVRFLNPFAEDWTP